MSEKTTITEEKVALSINLTDAEVKVIETLISGTTFPHEFAEKLDELADVEPARKLIMMYHFAQGHMFSAMHHFMSSALPEMMGLSSTAEEPKQ